jgi:xylose dehydrogenase (NAD/NADP)
MVRWGILSTANINRRVIPAIRASKRGVLRAVASREADRAKKYANQWEIPESFGSYEAMLESKSIDVVYISLPNHIHAEWTLKALEAGKHVLCEKPLALSLNEVDQMIAASQSSGCVLTEAFMYRHHPQTKLMGEWVRSGRLGDVILVRGTFNFKIQNRKNIRLEPDMGGGSLWDVGVYPISLAQFVMGEPPQKVYGEQWVGDTGVDETFVGQLHYAQDRLAQISSSFRAPFYTFVEILGSEGRLTLNRPFVQLDKTRQLIFHPTSGESEILEVEDKELYLGQIEDIHSAVLDHTPPYLSLQESKNHIRTVLALYESARKKEMVSLS